MKRTRDNSAVGSPSGASDGDQLGQLQTAAAGAGSGNNGGGEGGGGAAAGSVPNPTIEDALFYLNEVKETLKENYGTFHAVLKDFLDKRIDIDGVIARMKEILRGHDNLIAGFSFFLPEGYEM